MTGRHPLPRVNDSAAFNVRLIAGAMETLNDWWSQQPVPADPAAAPLAAESGSSSFT